MTKQAERMAVLEAELLERDAEIERLRRELRASESRVQRLSDRLRASNEQVVEMWRAGRGVRKRALRTAPYGRR